MNGFVTAVMKQAGIESLEELYTNYINCYHNSLSMCRLLYKFCPESSERMKFCKHYYLKHRYWENWWRMLWRIFGKIPFYLELKPIVDVFLEKARKRVFLAKSISDTKCPSCGNLLRARNIAAHVAKQPEWLDYFIGVLDGAMQNPTEVGVDFEFLCCKCFKAVGGYETEEN